MLLGNPCQKENIPFCFSLLAAVFSLGARNDENLQRGKVFSPFKAPAAVRSFCRDNKTSSFAFTDVTSR